MSHRFPQTLARWLELLTVGNAAFLIAGVSLASLASAWTFQFMGFEPCELCYAERNPYYFAVPAGLLAAMLANRAPKAAALLLAAICAALIYDAGLAAYHAGVEWHFWQGPDACTGNGPGVQATGSLSQKLRHNTARPLRRGSPAHFRHFAGGLSRIPLAGPRGAGRRSALPRPAGGGIHKPELRALLPCAPPAGGANAGAFPRRHSREGGELVSPRKHRSSIYIPWSPPSRGRRFG